MTVAHYIGHVARNDNSREIENRAIAHAKTTGENTSYTVEQWHPVNTTRRCIISPRPNGWTSWMED
jgi:hypothetical protein